MKKVKRLVKYIHVAVTETLLKDSNFDCITHLLNEANKKGYIPAYIDNITTSFPLTLRVDNINNELLFLFSLRCFYVGKRRAKQKPKLIIK